MHIIYGCAGSWLLCIAFLYLRQPGLLFFAVCGLLIVVVSLAVEHELQGVGFSSCSVWAQKLRLMGSKA